jgi:hypothetical protein
MNPQRTRRPGNASQLIRIALSGALLVTSACAAPTTIGDPVSVTSTTSAAELSADRVTTALSDVSLHLSGQLSDAEEDLILAWSDFEGDLRSVVNDLVRKPSRVDVEGMQQRVENVGELLHDSKLELPAAEWEEFLSAFQTLIDEVSAPDDSA